MAQKYVISDTMKKLIAESEEEDKPKTTVGDYNLSDEMVKLLVENKAYTREATPISENKAYTRKATPRSTSLSSSGNKGTGQYKLSDAMCDLLGVERGVSFGGPVSLFTAKPSFFKVPEGDKYFSLPEEGRITQEVYDVWRSRIRNSQYIKNDLQKLNEERNKYKATAKEYSENRVKMLQEHYNRLSTEDYGYSPEAVNAIRNDLLQQMQEARKVGEGGSTSGKNDLERRQKMLEEELSWAEYFEGPWGVSVDEAIQALPELEAEKDRLMKIYNDALEFKQRFIKSADPQLISSEAYEILLAEYNKRASEARDAYNRAEAKFLNWEDSVRMRNDLLTIENMTEAERFIFYCSVADFERVNKFQNVGGASKDGDSTTDGSTANLTEAEQFVLDFSAAAADKISSLKNVWRLLEDGESVFGVSAKTIGDALDDPVKYFKSKGYSEERIEQLQESYRRYRNAQNAELFKEEAAEYANEHPVIASIGSIPASILGDVASFIYGAKGYFSDIVGDSYYNVMDSNSGWYRLGDWSGAVRGQIAEDIAGDESASFLRKFGGKAYSGVMSALDNIVKLFLFGGKGSLALSAMGTFGNTVQEVSAAGGTIQEAAALGISKAGLEVLTEKLSIDQLLSVKDYNGAMGLIKNLAKTGAVEVSEEEMSFLGGLMLESAVLGQESNYNKRLRELQDHGMTEEEAREIVYSELWDEATDIAVTSYISGIFMEGVNSAVKSFSDAKKERQEKKAAEQIDEAIRIERDIAAQSVEPSPENIDKADLQPAEPTSVPQAQTQLPQQGQDHPSVQEQIERNWSDQNTDPEIQETAERLSQTVGKKIVVYNNPGRSFENGYFQNGVIYINASGVDPIVQTVSHELTHSIEKSDAYKEFAKLVGDRMRYQGVDIVQARTQKMDDYRAKGITLSLTDADHEVIAEWVSRNLLSNEESIRQVVQERPGLGRKLLNLLDRLLARFGNKNAKERAFVEKARAMYATALSQTQTSFDNQAESFNPEVRNTKKAAADAAVKESGQGISEEESMAMYRDELERAYANGEITEEEYDEGWSVLEQYAEENGISLDGDNLHFSISNSVPQKRDVANTLREILNRGGDPSELRQYVASLNGGKTGTNHRGGITQQTRPSADQNRISAEQILSAAEATGTSVQDYLYENWEQFEYDGELNEEAKRALDQERGNAGRKYSIVGPFTDNNGVHYDTAVLLDTMFFDDLSPRNWGSKLKDFVRFRAESDPFILPVLDENGGVQNLEFAKTGDRVYIAGKNKRNVLDELWSTTDNISKLSVIHIDEIVSVSDKNTPYFSAQDPKDNHNWLDENGWLHRNAFVINAKNGGIYRLVVDVAKAKDGRHIMYATKGKIKRVGTVQVNSLKHRGSGQNPNSSTSLTQVDPEVKRKDLEYKYAVENKDMKMAQKLVNEAAKTAGYTVKAYHGTNAKIFNEFDAGRIGAATGVSILGDGFYFSDNSKTAQQYGDRVFPVFLKQLNPYIATTTDVYKLKTIELEKQGYDSVVMQTGRGKIYVVFDSNQIKSADPATYDDNGDLIPLSERFNTDKTDIRYSINSQQEEHSSITNENEIASTEPKQDLLDRLLQRARTHSSDPNQLNESVMPRSNPEQDTDLQDLFDQIDALTSKRAGNPDNLKQMRDAEGDLSASKPKLEAPDQPSDVHNAKSPINEKSDQYQEPQKANTTDRQEPDGLELLSALPKESIRDTLSAKARDYLRRTENELMDNLCKSLSVPTAVRRDYLAPIVRKISQEYLENGRISQELTEQLFNSAYENGVVVDREFYDQYKDVKKKLQTGAVTLNPRDRSNIADYEVFRAQVNKYHVLRITESGGLPVDSTYRELMEMAPELFPESITHPADQLQRMAEVSRSIAVSEKSLKEYYGHDAEGHKADARYEFENAIMEVAQGLRNVQRVAQEVKEEKQKEIPTTPEEAMEAYRKLKDARRTYEKVNAKNLLTNRDEQLVGQLLRGEISVEDLQGKDANIEGITAVYEAKREYNDLCKLIAKYRAKIRSDNMALADSYLETALKWKDKKSGLSYSRETMTRNIYDIVPDSKLAEQIVREYIAPVAIQEAAGARFKNQYRDRIRSLDLSRKRKKGDLVSEAHAVQLLGEAMDNIRMLEASRGRLKNRDGKTLAEWRAVVDNLWLESPGLDKQKIKNAVTEFRKIYDELFVQMNDVRVANGYEPVNYRKGYFPHFQPGDGDGILAQFGKIMGIDTHVDALPTTINGITHMFKPGIQWFGNAQQRLGFNTAYDAVEGFDTYIEGVSAVIHQTQNIQKLRALASQIRYRTSDEGLRKQVDAVYADSRLTEEEKRVHIEEIFSKGKFTLSNFVNELDEYTNILANKKSRYDRTVEAAVNRKIYRFLKKWNSRVAANMIVGNLASYITNFIPLTQSAGRLGRFGILKGMWGTLKAGRQLDDIAYRSTFLTNRRGSDPIVKSWSDRASAKAGWLMEVIDQFTAGTIVRAAYAKNLKQGLSETEAMYQADLFAAGVMADRSKGAMPTIFHAQNPFFKAFTQFQLEVNNQFSELFKDLPRQMQGRSKFVLAGRLFSYMIFAYLFNELYEFVAGRRPALDPISMINEAVGDATGYEMPNLIRLGLGQEDFKVNRTGTGDAVKNLASNALGQLPFSSGLGLLGIETDGGRVPASAAVPDLTALWDAATTEGWSSEKRWKESQDELNKLAYIIPPFGGNAVQKVWKSTKALLSGGSYSVDSEGRDILQYPVYTDDPGDAIGNAIRMMIFGKNSTMEAQNWVDSGFDSFGAKQTAVYQDMLTAGVKDKNAYALIQAIQDAEKTDSSSRRHKQVKILRESAVSGDGKAVAYYGLIASESERKIMDEMLDAGADAGEVADILMDIRLIGSLPGAGVSCRKRDIIMNATLTDEEKAMLYRATISGARDDDIELFESVGLKFDLFLEANNRYALIDESCDTAGEKTTAFSRWVNSLDITQEQAEVIKDCFKYFMMTPVTAGDYEKLTGAGLDDKEAFSIHESIEALEPEEGKTVVSNSQKWEAIISANLTSDQKLSALREYMTDSEYGKLEVSCDMGLSLDVYVKYRCEIYDFDADGNGSMTQAEVKSAVDSIPGLNNRQRAVLWQLSNKGWKSGKNPYDTSVGLEVYNALNSDPESETASVTTEPTKEPESFQEELLRQMLGGG